MKLNGLYTAMITPFTSDGNIDREGFRQNLCYQVQSQIDGIVVLGTTGESPTLNAQEKKMIIEIALEEVKGKIKLIVGTGTNSTQETIKETRFAEEIGADAALIITPYYNRPTQEGIYRHFEAICLQTSLPLCLYNHPKRTGQNIQPETLFRLALLPSIIGIKECSADFIQISTILEHFKTKPSNFSLLSGDDPLTLPLFALGGQGIISVSSNLFPGPMKNLVRACQSNDFVEARKWHNLLLPFFIGTCIETNPAPIKAAMEFCGLAAGSCRLPLCDLSSTNLLFLKQTIQSLPLSWLEQYGQTQSACC